MFPFGFPGRACAAPVLEPPFDDVRAPREYGLRRICQAVSIAAHNIVASAVTGIAELTGFVLIQSEAQSGVKFQAVHRLPCFLSWRHVAYLRHVIHSVALSSLITATAKEPPLLNTGQRFPLLASAVACAWTSQCRLHSLLMVRNHPTDTTQNETSVI